MLVLINSVIVALNIQKAFSEPAVRVPLFVRVAVNGRPISIVRLPSSSVTPELMVTSKF